MGYALTPLTGVHPAAGAMPEKERSTTQAAAADSEVTTQQEVSRCTPRPFPCPFPGRWLGSGNGRGNPVLALGRLDSSVDRSIFTQYVRSPLTSVFPRRGRAIGPEAHSWLCLSVPQEELLPLGTKILCSPSFDEQSSEHTQSRITIGDAEFNRERGTPKVPGRPLPSSRPLSAPGRAGVFKRAHTV